MSKMPKRFDPEMLYIECSFCGRPVMWDEGEATEFIAWSGINAWSLDFGCLILTDGCPSCEPEENSFETYIVRATDSRPSPADSFC